MSENKLIAIYKKFNEKHRRLAEIIRFLVIGGLATIIDMLVMGVVLYLFDPSLYPKFYNVWIGGGDPETIATIIGTGSGFLVSVTFNYILSVLFVYENKGNSKSLKGRLLFLSLSFIGLLINMFGMWVGYDICNFNEWLTKIIMTLIVLVYNYTTKRLLIFKKVKPASEPKLTEETEITHETNIKSETFETPKETTINEENNNIDKIFSLNTQNNNLNNKTNNS